MKSLLAVAFASMVMPSAAFAAEPAALTVELPGMPADQMIPEKFAFCAPDAEKHTKDGGNISPEVSWNAGPEGTKSYVVIMHDPDVPSVFDNANKEGATIAADLKRQNFYHWLLADIPATMTALPEGIDSTAVSKPGKDATKLSYGQRGVNDYTKFMGGTYAGYDGSCPPWNDESLHHYHFSVYALDVPSLNLKKGYTGPEALAAMEGHVLAKGEAVRTYTQNPKLR